MNNPEFGSRKEPEFTKEQLQDLKEAHYLSLVQYFGRTVLAFPGLRETPFGKWLLKQIKDAGSPNQQ